VRIVATALALASLIYSCANAQGLDPLCAHPETANVASSVRADTYYMTQPFMIDFVRCFYPKDKNDPDHNVITCVFRITHQGDHAQNYTSSAELWPSTLTDNFHIDHTFVNVSFLNGKCRSQSSVNLNVGDSVLLLEKFAGETDGVTQATITFHANAGYGKHYTLRGPVAAAETR
jgi:hypothetical protein